VRGRRAGGRERGRGKRTGKGFRKDGEGNRSMRKKQEGINRSPRVKTETEEGGGQKRARGGGR